MEVRTGMSSVVLTVGPSHTLRQAAEKMSEKGTGAALVFDEMSRRHIRHLVVVEAGELVGVLSMRDIVRVWTSEGATASTISPEAEQGAA